MLNRVEIRRLTWPLQNNKTFLPSKAPGLLLLYDLDHRPVVLWSAAQSTFWLNLGRQYIPIHFRIHPAASVTSSLNTSIPVPLDVMHAHAFTPLQHVSQMMLHALDHELFQAFSILFLPIIQGYRLILISAVQRMLFQKWSGFFRCFWQSLIWPYLHLVVNPLYLPSWSLLLIVDFDSGMPSSWRVFFSWLDVVKGFFFTMERILQSSTTVVLRGRPCLFMLLSSLVRSFFSEYTKLLIWPLLMLEA